MMGSKKIREDLNNNNKKMQPVLFAMFNSIINCISFYKLIETDSNCMEL